MELMLTVAIIGILGLVVTKAVGYLMVSQMKSQAQADLQNDAIQIIQKISTDMQTAGVGVPNCSAPGKSIFATLPSVNSPTIAFFYQDSGSCVCPGGYLPNCPQGYMDTQDRWLQYSLQNGQIYRTIFKTNYSGGADPLTSIVSQSRLSLSSNAVISSLQFNYYTSGSQSNPGTPQMTSDGYAASQVRVHLEVRKNGTTVSRDEWIPLVNVLNAQQISSCNTPC